MEPNSYSYKENDPQSSDSESENHELDYNSIVTRERSMTLKKKTNIEMKSEEGKSSEDIKKEDDPIMTMVREMQEKISKSIKYNTSIFNVNILKNLVSKKKLRFDYEGFNLDLSYITENIIAMGFPADNFQSIFRNGRTEVLTFFQKRHPGHYKVYNLCAEKTYRNETFFSQAYFPFKDHEAPPINLMLQFCKDVHEYLMQNQENVVAIHCKAGKGRTGTMICCYLLYINLFSNPEDALRFYGHMRTLNGKGVTIPSQIRYVYYFSHILKNNLSFPLVSPILLINKIKLITVPRFSLGSKSTPYFKIFNDNSEYNFKKHNELQTYKNEAFIEFKINNFSVGGDVQIIFYNKNTIGKDKMFSLWFNTYFAQSDGVLIFKKSMLDKACKDKNNALFDSSFRMEIYYMILDSNFKVIDNEFFNQESIGSINI
jgi:phosphatidylinositol-3,4,5-trisphosphate 3-phosphatase/dual-specificity protein phosphatase PTEN